MVKEGDTMLYVKISIDNINYDINYEVINITALETIVPLFVYRQIFQF